MTVISIHLKTLLLIFIYLLFESDAHSQITTTIKSGASSIDLNLKSAEAGNYYYVVYSTINNNPTPSSIKSAALTSISGSIIKNGKAIINFTDLNKNLTRQITNLTDDKSYYIYGVFESFTSGLKNVDFFKATLPARQVALEYISSVPGIAGTTVRYLLYKPESTLKDNTQRSPLLLFFHGDGEKGTDLNLVKRNGPPKLINQGIDLDFTVASPQILWPIQWDTPGFLEEFIKKIKALNVIDTNRVYITALSGGGGGLYYYTKTNPSKVAAVIPVSAVSVMKTGEFCSLKNIAFWGFHNLNDPTVGVGNLNSVIYGISLCLPAPLIVPLKTIYQSSSHDAWTVTYNNMLIYPWLLSKSKKDRFNQAPQVSLGNDITINLPISLNSQSKDNDGTITSYLWEKRSGPDITLINQNQPTLYIKDLIAGKYNFRLTVTDNAGVSASDDITVTVTAPPVNNTPVVSSGSDLNLTMPIETTTLTGTAADKDGTITGYAWTQLSGPEAVLSGTDTPQLVLDNLTVGAYTFQLVAADDEGSYSADQVTVIIEEQSSLPSEGNGLTGTYYNKNDLSGTPVLTRTDSTINFNWGAGSPQSPLISVNNFSIRWEGEILAPQTGEYTFYTLSDDGIRFWLNNTLLINNWTDHALTTNTGVINLIQMQKYPVVIEYHESWGNAVAKLLWSYSGQSAQIIPKGNLYSSASNERTTRPENHSDIQWYPNPVADALVINYSPEENENILEIHISDITGRTFGNYSLALMSDEANTLMVNTKNLEQGVYLIEFRTNSKKIIHTFIKQ